MQRFKSWLKTFSVLLALLSLFSVPLLAQTFRGSINGTVTDSSGAVVPGAKVTATDVSTAAGRDTVTSGAGEFLFSDLPLSTYTVKVEAAGFQTTEVTGVQVLAGKIYTLPVKLSVTQQATTIEVSADSLSLDTTTVTQTTTLEGKSLQDVPLNGRDFTQLLGTSAAFAGYNNTGSVNGTRSNQINYTINGTDNNDLYLNADAVNQGSISGIAGVIYPIDALDEYSLQTTGNSETGRSPGGNLNVTTKSGTNEFHGDAYYYNRNEALAVASPFHTPGSPALPLRNQNYGASVGGPLWRDHTFLFLLYEEQKFVIGEANNVTEPSPAYQTAALAELSKYGVQPSQVSQNILNTLWDPSVIANLPANPLNYTTSAPESGYSHNVVAHLDHNFSDRSHLSAIWYFGQGFAVAPSCVFVCGYLPEYFQSVPSHIQNFNTVWNFAIRPNLSNQLAAGASFFTQAFADANHSQDPLTLAGLNTGASLSGAPQLTINGFDSIGVTPTSGRNDISGQLADTLSWTVGKHQVRFGLEYRRAYIDLYYNWGGRGAFNFGTGPSPLGPWAGDPSVSDPNVLYLADYMAGYAYTSGITLGTQERFIYTHTGSAFAEDSWQVTPKLNVNLGLRYDYQQPFYTNPANLSIFDPNNGGLVVADSGSGTPQYIYDSNKLNFSPRFGLSYQPFSHTVIRANYGLYFDQPAGQAFFGNIGIPNGGAGGVNNNPAGSQPNESIVLNAPSTPTPIWTSNQATPIFTASQGQPTGSNVVSIYSASRNFKTPYAELFGLNIEQSLGSGWQLNVGYVGSVSRHNLVLQDINQNALGGDQNPSTVTVNGNTFTYQQSTRPYFSQYPNFGIINQLNSAASASYNALQITLRSNLWHGFTNQFAYTWSHNLDDSSAFNILPQNSNNLAGDWGNAEYDVRNHFSAYVNYAIPTLAYGPKALTRGWEVNGILKFQNGEPVNILSGSDNSGTAEGEDRGTITGSALNNNRSVQGHSFAQYLNPSSFAAPAPGTYGNLGRNQVIGPGFSDVDLSLIKNIPIYKERVRAQFRVEMFNVLNHINLAAPVNNVASGSFGASTSTIGIQYGAPGIGSGEPYNTQLALKIIF
ncbi:TonB-dependent receptor domain-containing protein [Acidicapsa acidisoli]|uniref:TonB-dependent receptor domain-containing protein n=1 Tax=Acidicapsa acidisoli TaxID=1615681 RepID=UPI0021E0BC54|nr:TonB-dependent receptor [Acidicapsa acidisoli]